MSFLHLSLATLGGSLVTIPIVLHLLMRRKPKPLTFPALRFVKARKESNQRRLRLRQLALLALRCAAICCLALALARPRVPTSTAGNWWLLVGLLAASATLGTVALFGWTRQGVSKWVTAALGLLATLLSIGAVLFFVQMQQNPAVTLLEDAEAPVAAALLFDVSPRMGYRHQNQTRLEVAQELGQWVLQQLAFDSQIAVLDTATTGATFCVDRSTARKSIRSLRSANQARPIPQMLDAAIRLLRESEEPRKEIYILTDMTAGSWLTETEQTWEEQLGGEQPIIVYVLDVGVESPTNFRLGVPDFASEYLAGDQELDLNIELSGDGIGGMAQLQVFLEKPDPTLPIVVDGKPVLPERVLRGQQELDLPKDGTAVARFSLSGPGVGTHHGLIRSIGSDGLEIDNERFFTIEVTPTRQMLVAVGPGTEPSLLTDVLGPVDNDDAGQALFQCTVVRSNRMLKAQLSDYDAVALLDPPPLSVATWQALAQFVRDGGGLGVFLGRNAAPADQFNSPAALEILPGTIDRQWRAGGQDIYLTLGSSDHRVLRGVKTRETTIPWNNFPVFRHWGFQELREGVTVVLRYGNGQPALVESYLGQGRILTMTTPVSDALNVTNRSVWNMLPTGENAWPYFVLTLDIFRYLSASGSLPLNYEIGDAATIAHSYSDSVKLFSPGGPWEEVASSAHQVTVPFTTIPGSYRLKGNPPDQPRRGISVNLPADATQLTRIGRDEIAALLGSSTFRLARERDEIVREIGESRMGREFFPWLMLAVVLLLAMEHLMANRFYAESGKPTAVSEPERELAR